MMITAKILIKKGIHVQYF